MAGNERHRRICVLNGNRIEHASLYLKVNGEKAEIQVREWLQVFSGHLTEAGLGHVSEIFDGDYPHLPPGCFAQAWSVAEVLRAVVENGLARKPAKQAAGPDRMASYG